MTPDLKPGIPGILGLTHPVSHLLAGAPDGQVTDSLDDMNLTARLIMAELATGYARVVARREGPSRGDAAEQYPLSYLLIRVADPPGTPATRLDRRIIEQLHERGFTRPGGHGPMPVGGGATERPIELTWVGIDHQLMRAGIVYNGIPTGDMVLTTGQAALLRAMQRGTPVIQVGASAPDARFYCGGEEIRAFDLRMLEIVGLVEKIHTDSQADTLAHMRAPVPWRLSQAGTQWLATHPSPGQAAPGTPVRFTFGPLGALNTGTGRPAAEFVNPGDTGTYLSQHADPDWHLIKIGEQLVVPAHESTFELVA